MPSRRSPEASAAESGRGGGVGAARARGVVLPGEIWPGHGTRTESLCRGRTNSFGGRRSRYSHLWPLARRMSERNPDDIEFDFFDEPDEETVTQRRRAV